MRSEHMCESLREGMVQTYSIDLRDKLMTMRVDVQNGGLLHYKVEFGELSSFNVVFQHTTPWERIELTEVVVSREQAVWLVEMNLWDSATLQVQCRTILINGQAVE